ncbi:MAG: permease prefix domain 1-containing protein [Planctomycetaceae bacterium]|nr:permease prefix domain 1-containing protein [Planctomycetaceae bacterium]
MNDKLCKHVNILFAAAPKNQKAEEIKEELLTNLNDKYNDLLSDGYDSTAAFHIALSGIGDIDELLRECGGTVQADAAPISPAPQESRLPVYSVLAFLLFCAFPVLPVILNVFGSSFTWELFCFFLVWVFAGSVVLYGIVSSYARRSGGAESTPTAPIFSKRKIVRMLVYLGLTVGILLGVDVFAKFYVHYDVQWFFHLCYMVAGISYIGAIVALVMKVPVPTEGNNVPTVPLVLPNAKPSRMPLLLALAFGLSVFCPVLGAIFLIPPNAIVFAILCWGIAGSILIYAIATLFTGRYGIVWFILAIVLVSVLSAFCLFNYFAYVF